MPSALQLDPSTSILVYVNFFNVANFIAITHDICLHAFSTKIGTLAGIVLGLCGGYVCHLRT